MQNSRHWFLFVVDEDPVEALRAYAERAAADPIFVTNAYKQTQPKPVLNYAPPVSVRCVRTVIELLINKLIKGNV